MNDPQQPRPPRHRRSHRHPLEVTSDRIADHIDAYYDRLNGQLRDELSRARDILEALRDGEDLR
jgi:hypothetical protein